MDLTPSEPKEVDSNANLEILGEIDRGVESLAPDSINNAIKRLAEEAQLNINDIKTSQLGVDQIELRQAIHELLAAADEVASGTVATILSKTRQEAALGIMLELRESIASERGDRRKAELLEGTGVLNEAEVSRTEVIKNRVICQISDGRILALGSDYPMSINLSNEKALDIWAVPSAGAELEAVAQLDGHKIRSPYKLLDGLNPDCSVCVDRIPGSRKITQFDPRIGADDDKKVFYSPYLSAGRANIFPEVSADGSQFGYLSARFGPDPIRVVIRSLEETNAAGNPKIEHVGSYPAEYRNGSKRAKEGFHSMSLSPSGNIVAAKDDLDDEIHIYKKNQGERSLEYVASLEFMGSVEEYVWSADEKILAVVLTNFVVAFDLSKEYTGKEGFQNWVRLSADAANKKFNDAALNSDGSLLAVLAEGGLVEVYSLTDRAQDGCPTLLGSRVFEGGAGSIGFTPEGNELLIATNYCTDEDGLNSKIIGYPFGTGSRIETPPTL